MGDALLTEFNRGRKLTGTMKRLLREPNQATANRAEQRGRFKRCASAILAFACIATATLPISAFTQTVLVPQLDPNGQLMTFTYAPTDEKTTGCSQPTPDTTGSYPGKLVPQVGPDGQTTFVFVADESTIAQGCSQPTTTLIQPPPAPNLDPAPAPAPAPTINPYAAEAGPLTVFNCSGATIKVKTFNSNDTMLWVPFQELSIANGASAGLKCATSSCKLKVNSGGATAAMSGYQVYVGGAVKATNQAAMAKGRAIY